MPASLLQLGNQQREQFLQPAYRSAMVSRSEALRSRAWVSPANEAILPLQRVPVPCGNDTYSFAEQHLKHTQAPQQTPPCPVE